MGLTIEILDAQVEQLIKDIFDNYPEAGESNSLRCTKWDYTNFVFNFIDVEDNDKPYMITLDMAKRGFEKLISDCLVGKIFLFDNAHLFDAGEWDACATDALAQYAIFGETIYG
jgi:hypothetical protein